MIDVGIQRARSRPVRLMLRRSWVAYARPRPVNSSNCNSTHPFGLPPVAACRPTHSAPCSCPYPCPYPARSVQVPTPWPTLSPCLFTDGPTGDCHQDSGLPFRAFAQPRPPRRTRWVVSNVGRLLGQQPAAAPSAAAACHLAQDPTAVGPPPPSRHALLPHMLPPLSAHTALDHMCPGRALHCKHPDIASHP